MSVRRKHLDARRVRTQQFHRPVERLRELATPLPRLEAVIAQRAAEKPETSYTARLLDKGVSRVAQKVGEEGVEVALAGVNESAQKLIDESADLLFHLLVLLRARGITLSQVVQALEARH